jgi:PAS domain S-box-containing protein
VAPDDRSSVPADPLAGAGSQQVRVLLDAAPSGVVGVDAAGVVCYVNDRFARMFGYRPGEALGMSVEDLLPDAVRAEHLPHGARDTAAPGDGVQGRRHLGRRRDGSAIPVEVFLTPMTPEDGGDWVVAGVVDVFEQQAAEERISSLSRDYLTLAQINQAIVRAPDPATLFNEACRIAVEQGGYLGAWVGERGPGLSVRPVATAGVLDDYIDELGITLDPDDPSGQGPTARAMRESRPCYTEQFMTDPATTPWRALAAGRGIGASAAVPLRCGDQTVAVITLYSPRTGAFDARIRSLLEQLGMNMSFVLDGFAAADRLQRVAAQRSELLRRLVTAQEEERGRIAADVHDDSVQALAAVDLRLGLLRGRLRDAAPELEGSVEQIQATVATATRGLRQLLFDLEPVDGQQDCVAAIEEAAAHIFEDDDLSWTVECDGPVVLPDVILGQALRIVKEALINVHKHARARTVRVRVVNGTDGVEITVADDGVGVDVDSLAPRPGHRGLATMRDRAELTGGWSRVESVPGEGTTLRFWLPRAARDCPILAT